MAKQKATTNPTESDRKHEFDRLRAERPTNSSEASPRETEAPVGPDGDYLDGFGIGIVPMSAPQDESERDDPLFNYMFFDGIRPDNLPERFEEFREDYTDWFERFAAEKGDRT